MRIKKIQILMKKQKNKNKDYAAELELILLIPVIIYFFSLKYVTFSNKIFENLYFSFICLIIGITGIYNGIYSYNKGYRDLGVTGGWLTSIIYGILFIIGSILYIIEIFNY